MRIAITISTDDGKELLTTSAPCPDDGTAIDQHLVNAAADVKAALLRLGIDTLKSQS